MKLPLLVVSCVALFTGGLEAGHVPLVHESPNRTLQREWTVLVLFSEDAMQPATQALQSGLLDATAALDQTAAPRLFFEYLDATRPTPDRCPDDVMADLLRTKYAGRHIDLVVPIGEGAIEFAQRQRQSLWSDLPILFVATHNTRVDPTVRLPEASGLVFRFTFAEALAVARAVVPGAQHVALISGSSYLEKDRTAGYVTEVRGAGLEFIDLTGLRFQDVLKRVGRLPPETIVFLSGPLVDADGLPHSARKICETISAASNRPLFTTGTSQFLGCGITGGRLRDFREIGRRVGKRAIAMPLMPARRVDVVPAAEFTTLMFDARQLERWHIADRDLPLGSTVAFRSLSRWTTYRVPVALGAAAVAVQLLLIAAFMWLRPVAVEPGQREPTTRERHAGVVARELIEPLGALQLNLDAADRLLGAELVRVDELREIVRDGRELTQRSRDILIRHGALRNAAAIRAGHVAFGTLIEDSLSRLPEAVRRRIDVAVDEAASRSTIVADVPRLGRAIADVVIATAERATHGAPGDVPITLRTTYQSGRACITIVTAPSREPIDSSVFDALVSSRTFDVAIALLTARDVIEAHAGTIDTEVVSAGEIALHIAFVTSSSSA